MIFTSVFLPYAILGVLEISERPWRSVIHQKLTTSWLKIENNRDQNDGYQRCNRDKIDSDSKI